MAMLVWPILTIVTILLARLHSRTLLFSIEHKLAITTDLILKPVSYQVHSWNDLSLWPNGFKQGMQYMKIDAYFMANEPFCQNQQQVISNSTYGCFLLSHDSPISSRQYNSTDNVLQFITNNIHLFNSSAHPIFLAVCFKLDHPNPCDNSSMATKWRSTTTSLMNSFTKIINAYNLTVQIILDGDAADNNVQQNECLAHLWMPYIKTFTSLPSNPIAISNNATLGYDRFSVLDTSVKDNDIACTDSFEQWVKVGFEKYNSTPQAWLWWEPSSQSCLRKLTETYNNSQFIHQAGFYFAINIDIARFKVYSGYNSWNQVLGLKDTGSSSSFNFTNTSQVITSFVDGTGNVVVVSFVSMDNDVLYNIATASGVVANDLNVLQWKGLSDTGLNGAELTSVCSVNNGSDIVMAIASQNGMVSVLSMDKINLEIKNIMHGWLVPSVCGQVDVSSVFLQWHDRQLLISQQFVCNSSIFGIQKWLQNATAPNGFSEYGEVILIKQFEDIKDIEHVSIVVSTQLNIVVWSANKKIFGGWGSLTIGNIMQIGVGDKPRLSMNNDMIIMVHENAYCWISEQHLKRSTPATCKATPVSMKGVLAYSIGSEDDWENKFRYNDGMISVCDKYLIHGMYDGGSNPYSSIVIDTDGNVGIVSVHDGITDLVGYTELNSCGAPIKYNDLVLDSWKINIQ